MNRPVSLRPFIITATDTPNPWCSVTDQLFPCVSSAKSLCGLIDEATGRAERGKPFLVVEDQTLTYGDLLNRMARLNSVFSAKRLGAGDRIGIVTRSAEDMATLLLSGIRFGLSVLNLNPDQSATERRHAVSAAGLDHVFVDRDIAEATAFPAELGTTIIEPGAGAPKGGMFGRLLKRKASAEAPTGLAAEIAAVSPGKAEGPRSDADVALLLFTSGTTSRPKVVQLSHANLAAQIATFLKVYDYDPASRILNPLPLHFTDGILHGPLITFLTGATLYRPKLFQMQEIDQLLAGIYRDRITHFIAVPALLSLVDRLHDAFIDAFRTEDFRYIRSSGDRLPETLWRSVEDRFGVRVVNTYGLSETVCEALYCGPDEARFRHGTIGKPVDCEVHIVDDAGAPVSQGETGELLIRGDNIMLGYYGQPALTDESMLDGWFRTGDFAAIDEDGFVSIVGRKKALIISGGANIQPQDIVDALLAHPKVAEAFAFGLPDAVFGEIVACAVVPRKAASGEGAPSVQELTDHCRAHLAPNKVPRRIALVEALPRNAAGKVLSDRLKDEFSGRGPDGAASRGGDIEAEVFAIAGEVFGLDPAMLRRSSEPRTTPGWDSFAHVNLILATERHFGINLSARDVLSVARLEHLVERVAEIKAERL